MALLDDILFNIKGKWDRKGEKDAREGTTRIGAFFDKVIKKQEIAARGVDFRRTFAELEEGIVNQITGIESAYKGTAEDLVGSFERVARSSGQIFEGLVSDMYRSGVLQSRETQRAIIDTMQMVPRVFGDMSKEAQERMIWLLQQFPEAIKETMPIAEAEIGSAMRRAWEEMSDAEQGMTKQFLASLASIDDGTEGAEKNIASIHQALKDFEGTAAVAEGTFKTLFSKITGGFWKLLRPAFAWFGLWKIFGEMLVPMGQMIYARLMPALIPLQDAFYDIVDSLTPILHRVVPRIVDGVSMVAMALLPFIDALAIVIAWIADFRGFEWVVAILFGTILAWKVLGATINGVMAIKSAWGALTIKMAKKLTAFTKVLHSANAAAKAHVATAKAGTIAYKAWSAASAVLTTVIKGLIIAKKVLLALMGPIGLVFVAIVAAVVGLYYGIKWLVGIIFGQSPGLIPGLQIVGQIIVDVFTVWARMIKGIIKVMADMVSTIYGSVVRGIEAIAGAVVGVFGAIGGVITGVFDAIASSIGRVVSTVVSSAAVMARAFADFARAVTRPLDIVETIVSRIADLLTSTVLSGLRLLSSILRVDDVEVTGDVQATAGATSAPEIIREGDASSMGVLATAPIKAAALIVDALGNVDSSTRDGTRKVTESVLEVERAVRETHTGFVGADLLHVHRAALGWQR